MLSPRAGFDASRTRPVRLSDGLSDHPAAITPPRPGNSASGPHRAGQEGNRPVVPAMGRERTQCRGVVRPAGGGVTPHPLWFCCYQARLVGLLCCVVLPRLRLHSRCVARTLLCAYSRPPSDTGTMWSTLSDRGCGNRRLVSIGSPQSAHTVAVRRIRFLIRRHGRPALRRRLVLLGVAMLGEGGLLCGGWGCTKGRGVLVASLPFVSLGLFVLPLWVGRLAGSRGHQHAFGAWGSGFPVPAGPRIPPGLSPACTCRS